MSAPATDRQQASWRILALAAAQRTTQFAVGTSILIALADIATGGAISGLNSALGVIAGGVAVESIGGLLDKVAYDEETTDDEILTILDEYVPTIEQLLQTNQEIKLQVTRLASWQRQIEFAQRQQDEKLTELLIRKFFGINDKLDAIHSLIRSVDDQLSPKGKQVATAYSLAQNPFHVRGAIPPEDFVGRKIALNFIRSQLSGSSLGCISIIGERRIGKSSLLRYVRERAVDMFGDTPPLLIGIDLVRTRKHFMGSLRRKLYKTTGIELWSDRDDGDLDSLEYGLEELFDVHGVRLILCIDELEQLTQRTEQFDDLLEVLRTFGQIGKLGLLTASRLTIHSLCQNHGLLSPFYNIFIPVHLGLFQPTEWHSFIQKHMSVTHGELQQIEYIAGSHPFYTQLAAMRLWEAKHQGINNWEKHALNDCIPHWASQWDSLPRSEQNALQHISSTNHSRAFRFESESLQRRGLLQNRRPFSQAYLSWFQNRQP